MHLLATVFMLALWAAALTNASNCTQPLFINPFAAPSSCTDYDACLAAQCPCLGGTYSTSSKACGYALATPSCVTARACSQTFTTCLETTMIKHRLQVPSSAPTTASTKRRQSLPDLPPLPELPPLSELSLPPLPGNTLPGGAALTLPGGTLPGGAALTLPRGTLPGGIAVTLPSDITLPQTLPGGTPFTLPNEIPATLPGGIPATLPGDLTLPFTDTAASCESWSSLVFTDLQSNAAGGPSNFRSGCEWQICAFLEATGLGGQSCDMQLSTTCRTWDTTATASPPSGAGGPPTTTFATTTSSPSANSTMGPTSSSAATTTQSPVINNDALTASVTTLAALLVVATLL